MLDYQTILRAIIGCLLGGCWLGIPASVSGQVSFSAGNDREVEAEARIEAALAQRVTIDFLDTPLRDVIDTLQEQTGIAIKLTKKIEDVGVARDQPVTLAVRNVSVEAFLNSMLSDLNLAMVVRHEALFVTTHEDSQSPENMITRVYPVADLVDFVRIAPEYGGGIEMDFDPLIDMITSTIEPDSWQDVGGAGSIVGFENSRSLVVSTRRDLHHRIAGTIVTLRRSKGLPANRSFARPVDATLHSTSPIRLSSPLPVPNRGNGASLRFRPALVRPESAVQVGGGGLF